MPECHILGVRLTIIDRQKLEQEIVKTVTLKRKRLFAYLNIHAINLAWEQQRFRKVLNDAYVVYCDGEGVRLGARILGYVVSPRVVLTYWIWDLCTLFQEHGISVFFLGGKEDIVQKAVQNVRLGFPRLIIAGYHHGYFEKSGEESLEVVKAIERARPDVLFVAIGMPGQEYWIEENFTVLKSYAILPAGSMIDYVGGVKSPTPGWMADHGMEWIFRLIMEPKRLWKRYLIGNPLFISRVLRQRFRGGDGS